MWHPLEMQSLYPVGLPSGGCCSPILHTGKLAGDFSGSGVTLGKHPSTIGPPSLRAQNLSPSISSCASQLGVDFTPWGTVPSVRRHYCLSQMGGPPGILWVEANDAAQHCTPTIKNAPASDVNTTEVRNLISAAGWQPWQHPRGSQQNIPGDSVYFPKTVLSPQIIFFSCPGMSS